MTIATASIFLGLNLGITQAQPFYKIPAAYTAHRPGALAVCAHGWPSITVLVIILMAIFLYRMIAGRQLLAVGGNANAAETSGIPVKRMVILAHVISGVLAAIAGMLWSAQLGSAQPMIGQTWMLPSFAVPIIGGVALSGGSVSLRGTVLAAFLIAIINNALVHLQVDPYYVQFLLGLLILAAVGLESPGPSASAARRGCGMTEELNHVALEVSGASKAFPGVQALDNVSLTLTRRRDSRPHRRKRRGQEHADQDHHRAVPAGCRRRSRCSASR